MRSARPTIGGFWGDRARRLRAPRPLRQSRVSRKRTAHGQELRDARDCSLRLGEANPSEDQRGIFALVEPEIELEPGELESDADPLLRNPGLETLMVENPDADDAILVYGDWLAERGDPRGNVILLYREMGGESDPQRYVELKKRAEEIVSTNMGSFFGRFSDYCDNVRIRWRLGYFDDVRVRTRGGVAMALTLGTMMEAPAAMMTRVLTLEAFDQRAATAMMKGSLPALRSLNISGPLHGEAPPDSVQLGPLFVGEVAPRLVSLQFQQPADPDLLIHLAVSPIAAQLTHLAFSGAPIADEVAAVLATDFPRLRSFALDHCSVSPHVLHQIQASIMTRQQ